MSLAQAKAIATPISLEAIAFAPRFAMAICAGHLPPDRELDAHLRAALATFGVQLERIDAHSSDTRLLHGELPIGRGRLLSPDEACGLFGIDAPFLAWRSPCPFVGNVTAYFVWEHFVARDLPEQRGAFTDLIKGLFSTGLSFIARLDTGSLVELAVERALPLADLTDRWGFGDGDLLLTRAADTPYARAARQAAEAALTALGFRAEVEWVPTSHNPLRLAWHELPSSFWRKRLGWEPRRVPALYGKGGKPCPPRLLSAKTFQFWTLNLDALHDDALWGLDALGTVR
ncbi:MAG: hypothetical protein LBM75_04920 [Myxococcales bacterium]|jgi:hypothetical protein|nr:hypothetical protein [Myxococcales bacterium]